MWIYVDKPDSGQDWMVFVLLILVIQKLLPLVWINHWSLTICTILQMVGHTFLPSVVRHNINKRMCLILRANRFKEMGEQLMQLMCLQLLLIQSALCSVIFLCCIRLTCSLEDYYLAHQGWSANKGEWHWHWWCQHNEEQLEWMLL